MGVRVEAPHQRDLQQAAEEGDARAELVRELQQPDGVAEAQPYDDGQDDEVEDVEEAEGAELAQHALLPAARLLLAPPRRHLGHLHLQ
eukprot:scaffold59222_cov42-Phaeocystis_antarctica.AAC.1